MFMSVLCITNVCVVLINYLYLQWKQIKDHPHFDDFSKNDEQTRF